MPTLNSTTTQKTHTQSPTTLPIILSNQFAHFTYTVSPLFNKPTTLLQHQLQIPNSTARDGSSSSSPSNFSSMVPKSIGCSITRHFVSIHRTQTRPRLLMIPDLVQEPSHFVELRTVAFGVRARVGLLLGTSLLRGWRGWRGGGLWGTILVVVLGLVSRLRNLGYISQYTY